MVPAVLLAGSALPVYTNTAWIQRRSMSRPMRMFSIVRSWTWTALQAYPASENSPSRDS